MEIRSSTSTELSKSKAELAHHLGVHRSRISQMIKSGIIGPDALVGTGRHARILVDKAIAQIRERRHVGQGLGNGIGTKLQAPSSAMTPAAGDDLARQIQQERLEAERRKNRREALAEQVEVGRLVDVDDMRRELVKALAKMVAVFTGAFPGVANALAAEFAVPQRDVLHTLQREMNAARATAASAIRAEAEKLPETAEMLIQGVEGDSDG